MRRPNTNSSPTPDAFCRRAAYLMAMRRAKAAMKNTQAQPWVRSRPTYAPRAKRPAVTVTRTHGLAQDGSGSVAGAEAGDGGRIDRRVAHLVLLSVSLSVTDEPAARGPGLLKAGRPWPREGAASSRRTARQPTPGTHQTGDRPAMLRRGPADEAHCYQSRRHHVRERTRRPQGS